MSQDVLDMTDAIETCAADVTIRRYGPSTTNPSGLKVAGAVTTFVVRGLLVPASKEQIDRLPSGQRSTNTKALFNTTETANLRTADTPGASRADEIVDGSDLLEVQDVGNWTVGRFQEVLAQKVRR